ncbi:hypothetical protein A7K69_02730 [Parageobacillus thermoglucosidasius]|uniref:Uncharacterized protein n=1 Tax=Parageobacillus thermoglucosidasius TaxID=1426 RepID=A0A1B7KX57_PARTM|nr:hypothetical protein A7K69_02730 [Parageobacillus thermoglucosidasius]
MHSYKWQVNVLLTKALLPDGMLFWIGFCAIVVPCRALETLEQPCKWVLFPQLINNEKPFRF